MAPGAWVCLERPDQRRPGGLFGRRLCALAEQWRHASATRFSSPRSPSASPRSACPRGRRARGHVIEQTSCLRSDLEMEVGVATKLLSACFTPYLRTQARSDQDVDVADNRQERADCRG